ncbi:NUDIX domain-containing protein [Kitasatospora sp. NPDC051853]|uniref:NUDIX domain-containing protein n=1 Tax=Kitasatospora sp. NPDC051853 TaxID=3364058 RepID=UPI0037B6199E
MKQRVRAVLVTPAGTMLLIKRIRPGVNPYAVLVGGGVEDTDATLEEALLREIREEIAGVGRIERPFAELTNDKGEVEHFYVVGIEDWNFADRTGPEFSHDDRGEYLLEEVPLTVEAVGALNLMPPQVKDRLVAAVAAGDLSVATA